MLAITTKSPQALRALCELARRDSNEPVPIGELARARDIPVQFLEGVFGTLRRAGILQSQRGVKGGYSFARPAAEVTVLEIVELLEGDLAADAASAGPLWVEAVEAARGVLARTTVLEVAERETAAAGRAMYYI